MFKTCKYCDKKFSSIKTCRRHIDKRICLKRIEQKWDKIKKNMKICKRCGLILSSQYSLDKHLTKQVPCISKDLKNSLLELQKEFYNRDKIGRKKFLLKKEILCEEIGINISDNNLDISLSEKPDIKNETITDCETLTKEELIIKLKEKTECLNKVLTWVNISWELLKAVSPENIIYQEKKQSNDKIYEDIFSENEISNEIVKKIDVSEPENNKYLKNKKCLEFISKDVIFKEKKDWDNLLDKYSKKFNPLENVLNGYWNTDNFILKPVRHYADYYSRSLLVRNMKSSKMLTSIICPNFYPNYKSSLDTKIYIDITKKRQLWLRDETNKWNSVSFSVGFKNLIFHAVTAYVDLIRREREILPEENVSAWESEKESLENVNSENYKIIVKNLIKRIPKLSIHPEKEENRIAEEFNKDDDYRVDILTFLSNEFPNYSNLTLEEQETLLLKRIIHDVRNKNSIIKARQYHNKVIEHYRLFN